MRRAPSGDEAMRRLLAVLIGVAAGVAVAVVIAAYEAGADAQPPRAAGG